jgi:hypothetical protein
VITVLVEGDTDVPFVSRLCEASGFQPRAPRVANGKHNLDPLIAGFARAGRGSPHLVLRDLDADSPCAADWVASNGPSSAGAYFALRLAVHAVEAWFLADRAAAAKALHIGEQKIPLRPDEEADPKRTIVQLARASTKASVRTAIVPTPGMSRKAGPGYEGWLIVASAAWSVDRAIANSPSLARALRRLTALCAAWESTQTGSSSPTLSRTYSSPSSRHMPPAPRSPTSRKRRK